VVIQGISNDVVLEITESALDNSGYGNAKHEHGVFGILPDRSEAEKHSPFSYLGSSLF